MEREKKIRAIPLDELPFKEWKDKQRHQKKPPWLRQHRCKCGSRKLRLLHGHEDGLQTPKKIRCLRCTYETEFWLTKEQCINEFNRYKET